MTIVCDSRERKWSHVKEYFESQGLKCLRNKLPVADYARMDNLTLCIDRKQHLGEVETNLIGQHERFRKECEKAQEHGIKLVVLVEHGQGIACLEDVARWQNPRRSRWERIDQAHQQGRMLSVKIPMRPPVDGHRLCGIMKTMAEKYGVEWQFCSKEETGRVIVERLQALGVA